MVVHQSVFAVSWAMVCVLTSVCRPAWRVQGAVWCSVRAVLGIEWRSECAGVGSWERGAGFFYEDDCYALNRSDQSSCELGRRTP